MPNRQFKTGTGRIRGRVTSSETGAPVRRAQVRISGADIAPKAAMTDAQGRFEFGDLPAGRFTLTSTKSGYVTVQYGQTRPFESGRPIELADKQALDKADISMPRGSVITGRIVDEFGEPVADANVTAMRQQWTNGRRRLLPAGRTAQTNDLGQYRMYGLPPGDYYVSATLRNMDVMAMDMMMMRPIGAGGAPAGPARPLRIRATRRPISPEPRRRPTPSASPWRSARKHRARTSRLSAVRMARITGIVLNSEGRAGRRRDGHADVGAQASRVARMLGGGARTNREGAFTLSSVAPGDYILQVRSVRS